MRLIKINNILFALNFEWRIKKSKKADIFKDLQKSKEKFDFVAFRHKQYADQYAIAEKSNRYENINYKRVSSLAATITLPSNSFLGVFCLKDIQGQEFYWLLAIHQGVVLALGDKTFNSKEEAERFLPTLKALVNFEIEIIYDKEIESLVLLENLISKKFFYPKLELGQSSNKDKPKYLVPVLTLSFLVLAFLVFDWYREEKLKQEQLLLAQKQQEYKQRILANPSQHFALTWQNAVSVQDMTLTCLNQVLAQPLFFNAWELESAVCKVNELIINWKQSVRSDYLRLPPNSNLESPSKAVAKLNLQVNKTYPRNDQKLESLLTQDQASRNLYQITKEFKLNSKLIFAPAEKKIIEQSIELTAPFIIGNFELSNINSVTMFDNQFIQALAMPGLITESLEISKNLWTIQGKIYAKTQK